MESFSISTISHQRMEPQVCLSSSSSLSSPSKRVRSFRTPILLLYQNRSKTSGNNDSIDTKEMHKLFQTQMEELRTEREMVFGSDLDSGGDDDNFGNGKNNQQQHISHDIDFQKEMDDFSRERKSVFGGKDWMKEEPTTNEDEISSELQSKELLFEEREAMFQFTDDERNAWSNHDGNQNMDAQSFSNMVANLNAVRQGAMDSDNNEYSAFMERTQTADYGDSFTHINSKGDSASMVDVGAKISTRREATARSVVVFPPEVMSAFHQHGNMELVGPKGPIFSTAKLAGIMGAKHTSNLIPLCHQLPLDRVKIDIRLEENTAIIKCECCTTHKTGVEMEALTGATIAALTIYDMVKAVSHRVRIEKTELIRKTGGKRNVDIDQSP